MNAEQKTITDFLKTYRNLFVSVTEISKALRDRRRFDEDRNWARPILRRMEMDGLVESNPFGEYRLKQGEGDTVSFRKALNDPSAALGDTAIIMLEEPTQTESETETKTLRSSDTKLREQDTEFRVA